MWSIGTLYFDLSTLVFGLWSLGFVFVLSALYVVQSASRPQYQVRSPKSEVQNFKPSAQLDGRRGRACASQERVLPLAIVSPAELIVVRLLVRH